LQDGHSTLVFSETPFVEPERPINGNARPHGHCHAALFPVATAWLVLPALSFKGTILCSWLTASANQKTAAPSIKKRLDFRVVLLQLHTWQIVKRPRS